jgi:hypothetical protein
MRNASTHLHENEALRLPVRSRQAAPDEQTVVRDQRRQLASSTPRFCGGDPTIAALGSSHRQYWFKTHAVMPLVAAALATCRLANMRGKAAAGP